MKKWALFISLACIQFSICAQQIHYVKEDATGSNNGSNWADAFLSLQSALQIAHQGDQIWVAKGTYKPTSDFDRGQAFVLPTGVSILGGFAGMESSISQRNIAGNPTILSGEIGVQSNRADNSFHVVTILGGDSLTQVDGFKIILGNADGQEEDGIQSKGHGGGIFVATDGFNPIAKPIIKNCFFENNHANRGGAIACLGNADFACVPKIENCTFTRNRAEYYGGSIYKEGINLLSQPFVIKNCLSTKNYCQQVAGGFAIIRPSGIVRLYGCRFTSDSGRVEVGGLYLETGEDKTKYEIDSCFFTGNYSYNGCGGVTQLVIGLFTDSIEIDIKNTLFFLNKNIVGSGGGLASYGFSKSQKVNLYNCVFSSNFSQNGGGGVWIEGSGDCNTEINTDRCFFFDNQTGGAILYAGAFFYRGNSSNQLKNKSTISNSVFMFNDGAIASLGGNPAITDARIVNCSFYRNGPYPFFKYWRDNLPSSFHSTMQILNSVIWEPEADGVGHLFYNNDPNNLTVNDYTVEHSIIHLPSCELDGVNPCQEGMIYAQWPNFIDSVGQLGLIPWPDNPGLNKGSNIVADTFDIFKDFEGVDRIYCDSVDIGAYEIQANCSSGLDESIFDQIPLSIRIIQNPVSNSEPIAIEMYSIKSLSVNIKLHDMSGRQIWHEENRLFATIPEYLSIPTQHFYPGLYYLNITANNGKHYVQKVVID